VAASTTRVRDHLRRRLRKPDRRLRSLALPVGESGTARRLSRRRGLWQRVPKNPCEPDRPEHPPAAPGLAERSRALEAPRPVARSGGSRRRSRRDSGRERTRTSMRRTTCPHPHRRAPSRTRGPGWRSLRKIATGGGGFVARCAELQAKNPLFKERVPELHVVYRAPVFPGRGECRASWRFTRFGSPAFAR
jgi:hypothetical protein